MFEYDVIIIGGGPAGLSSALTFASAKKNQAWAKEKKILLIDDDNSDLKKAHLFNVPAVAQGTAGRQALAQLKKQVESFGVIEMLADTVTDLQWDEEKKYFSLSLRSEKKISAGYAVVATGFHEMKIASLQEKTIPNANSPRAGKIQFAVDQASQISKGLFAAGLVAGYSSMFAAAAGSGVQVACNIFKLWQGASTIVHDVWHE